MKYHVCDRQMKGFNTRGRRPTTLKKVRLESDWIEQVTIMRSPSQVGAGDDVSSEYFRGR